MRLVMHYSKYKNEMHRLVMRLVMQKCNIKHRIYVYIMPKNRLKTTF